VKYWFVYIGLLFSLAIVKSQDRFVIYGTVHDEEGQPVEGVNVVFMGTRIGTSTDKSGYYEISAPVANEYKVLVSHISYDPVMFKINPLPGQKIRSDHVLRRDTAILDNVVVSGRTELTGTVQRLEMKNVETIPTSGSGVETLLKTLPGVSSNNEMSSQYNVRGGSFDENLVYVNDVEVYRPFLIRSGLQEGLSFINSDMVESLRFSAGGFDVTYGDRMSSVLDIRYRRPAAFSGNASASLLGGNLTLEGISGNKKFTWIGGLRYKTNQYLLGHMDTHGEYKPVFADVQTLLTYAFNEKWDLSFFGTFSQNRYRFIPEYKETKFGSISQVYQLKIYYDGQEDDRFNTGVGALTLHCQPAENFSMKWIASAFSSSERETFDLLGQYWINELGNAFDQKNDSIAAIGVGSFLMHARNRLYANVFSLSHKAWYDLDVHKIRWGISWQKELLNDRLDEWTMIDSAGYSIPVDTATGIISMYEVGQATNVVENDRVQAYLQDNIRWYAGSSLLILNAGVRTHYTSYTHEFAVIPRASLSVKPSWKKDWLFYLSSGYYPQMPFFREMRDPDGNINSRLRSQKSVHFVLGGDYNFMAWNKPFKLTIETYYKHLWDMVPYKVENVRIQYAAENVARGYAAGLDVKVNGEFIKGTESWVSFSLMQTRERNSGLYYTGTDGSLHPLGYYPRPSDQLVHVGIFLQDYLPTNPSYRVHLMMVFGSGLPVNHPFRNHYEPYFSGKPDFYRLPPYRRVDVGLSKVIKREDKAISAKNPLRFFKQAWITLELLNMLNIENTVSYMWLRTVGYQSVNPGWYAVPNYLTPRLLNLKLTCKF